MRSRPWRRSSRSLDGAGVEPGDLARPRPARTRGPRPPRSAVRASRRPAAGRCAPRARRAPCRAARSATGVLAGPRAGDLLEEERIPLGAGDDRASLPLIDGGLEQQLHELGALAGVERLDRDPGEAHAPAAPRRPARRQLGPRGADQEERALGVTGDVLEQLEHGRVGPLDVLHEHAPSARPRRGPRRTSAMPGASRRAPPAPSAAGDRRAARPMLAVRMAASSARRAGAGAREHGLGGLARCASAPASAESVSSACA